MSGINRVRNLKILYFSNKNKEIKKTKKRRKKASQSRYLYILLTSTTKTLLNTTIKPALLKKFQNFNRKKLSSKG